MGHYLVIFVVDEIEHCPELFDAWEEIGVTGVTIIESTGLGRIRRAAGYRDDLPLMPSLRNLLQTQEEHHRTLMVLVKEEAIRNMCNCLKVQCPRIERMSSRASIQAGQELRVGMPLR